MNDYPFFIIGCVRSGTTMLRDILRRHPALAAPEETHFYRWPEPFGGHGFWKIVTDNQVLKRHRVLDGIEEAEFQALLAQSLSRADLYTRYMQLYISKSKPGARRWFDKTPQNVYGAAMIAAQLPEAKFIHIVRDPLDVVSSLRIGKVVKVDNLVGACNYWNEAIEILQTLKAACPARVIEVRYETFVENPLGELEKLLAFIGEDYNPSDFEGLEMQASRHEHETLFTAEEREKIARLCHRWVSCYGYSLL